MEGQVNMDMLANGQQLVNNILGTNGGLDPGLARPYYAKNKHGIWGKYMTVCVGKDANGIEVHKSIPITTNATLRRDEWKQLDEAIIDVSRERLGGVADLITNGLVWNLQNAMGTTILEHHTVSDAMEAQITMDGVNRGRNDKPDFHYHYTPVPIISVDYEIDARTLASSRSLGNSIEVIDAQDAARKVDEKLESLLFTNTSYSFGEKGSDGRNSIYSYLSYPDRNKVTLSIPWDHSAITAGAILQDVQDMKAALIAAHQYGPFMIYIPTAYERVLDDDYTTTVSGTTLTIRERILKLDQIKGIKVIDTLTTDNVLMVQMKTNTVRLVRGMGLTNIQWGVEGNMLTKYKVMTIQVPQIRSDYNGKCGIAHMA